MAGTCGKCGLSISQDDIYCGNCGTPAGNDGGARAAGDGPGHAAGYGGHPPAALPRAGARPAQGLPGAAGDGLPRHTPADQLTFDPLVNNRFQLQLLRQFGLFLLIGWLIEWGVLILSLVIGFLGAGIRGATSFLGVVSFLLWIILTLMFWLIPVPALLTQWGVLIDDRADAEQAVFQHISEAIGRHETPLDREPAERQMWPPGEPTRRYLELRRGRFTGMISCFAFGRDLYVGCTFWLYLSPLHFTLMVIGRKFQDITGRGNDMNTTLRFDSTKAMLAAMRSTADEGVAIAIAAGGRGPSGQSPGQGPEPLPVRGL
jgi:hypothetical protein